MKYPYIVKVSGVYYEAGQEVPAFSPVKEVKEEIKQPTYTKTEINRMNKETLVDKAKEIGVEDAEEMSGNALKDLLIEHYL